MVPFITKMGKCFNRAISYFCYDKESRTTERIGWIVTRNLMTDDPVQARRIMEFTYRNRERLKRASGRGLGGRPVEEPVFSYSLSWHPEEKPTKQDMLDAAEETLATLGLSEHEAIITRHDDEPHSHVHLVVNRIHPLLGIAANLSHSKRKLSEFASRYERVRGKIYCFQREENRVKRTRGEKTRYRSPAIEAAWAGSSDAHGFVSLLAAQGYQMANGDRRLVVVDPYGQVINPVRHLKGVKAAAFAELMRASFPDGFPSIGSVKATIFSTQPNEPMEE